jgi:uncharacterized protein YkwD
MKTNTLTSALNILTIAMLASCASPSLTTRVPVSAASKSDAALASVVLNEVNAYRTSHGAKNLQRYSSLDKLAQQHSMFLCKNRGKFTLYGSNVSHYGFEGRALVAQRYYNMSQVGENVAAANKTGSHTASNLVNLWAHSPSHEVNMREAWTGTGIGVVVDDDGMVFATQMFGTPQGSSQMAMVDSIRSH